MMSLLLDVLARPSRAVERLRQPDHALRPAVRIFVLYLVVNTAFQTLKPADFPSPGPDSLEFGVQGDWLFWVKVQLYNIPLTAAWIALAAWFCRLLGEGRLPRRVAAAGAALALPLGLILLEHQGLLPRGVAVAVWLAIPIALLPSLRSVSRDRWLELIAFFLCLDAIALAATPILACATLLRAETLYHAVEMGSLLWLLAVASFGLARLAQIRTARAFLAIFLSALGQILALYGMHRLGLVSKEILKGLMSV
ncbi:MAG TPA: hypothetical protein VNI01_10730 [Elusimicrobiota bacterium]|jgi:hypothetical protein|nr:hypothetical protein [Elusimicrobiota bacterium]